LDSLRAARAVVRGFRGEKISLRASALTYISMLSLVPLLAVLFAIVRGLGQEGLRKAVHEFVFNNLAPGVREQIGGSLDEFIARASARAMGGLGGLFLLASAVGLFHNIERSLDEIWGVTRPRTILRRVVIYWCVLTLGPVALAISVLATSLAQAAVEASLPKGVLAMVPWATSAFALFFLYFAVPNAKVRVRAALGGCLVAATAWEIAKHLYTFFATHSFKYNAIYGSLGAVPLFLLWVYVSWMVVLFGARLAYALQYAITASNAPKAEDARSRELLCARVALEAVVAFQSGEAAPTPGAISRALALDTSLVTDAVESLREGGLLAEAIDGGVVPSRSPDQIRLVDVARAAGGTLFDHSTEAPSKEPIIRALSELFSEADRLGREALAQDLSTLARPLLEGRGAPRPEKAAIPKI
ncbi:MAG: YihY family inner membrane protein, partial [Deltaproteobacteria bacterium]|nr:YihY family inner membrane protein [Deltaproteobacteria bacterium]